MKGCHIPSQQVVGPSRDQQCSIGGFRIIAMSSRHQKHVTRHRNNQRSDCWTSGCYAELPKGVAMFSKTRMAFVLSLLLTAILTLATGWAQVQDGNLVGSVFDSTGATIPGAKVELE